METNWKLSMNKEFKELLNDVWKEGWNPGEWREAIIVPIYKNGDEEKMENYRGICYIRRTKYLQQ